MDRVRSLAHARWDTDNPSVLIRRQVERLAQGLTLNLDLTTAPIAPADMRLALRLVQGAIANTLTHGDADTLSVRFQRRGQRLLLEVEDNGPPPESITMGRGLHMLQARVAQHGGTLTLDVRGSVRVNASWPAASAP